MPLIWTTGDLFDSKAQGLVNPVNCVGAPGAGLALQFRNRWPAQVNEYVRFCDAGKMKPGLVHDALIPGGRRILSIATKRHWRDDSRIEDVDLGLSALKEYLDATGLISVALPALGCGLGGLDKATVAGRVKFWLDDNFSVVYVYGLDEPVV
jgi:O-acetyl-ADP-ribose deacetylase (regulator of RNase III)